MAEFQAGSAYLQIIPSLRGAQTKITADVKRMFAGGFEVKVVPEVDTAKAEAAVGAFASRMHRKISAAIGSLPDVKLGIDANTDAVTRRILQIKRELEALNDKRIGIDIDAAQAQRQVDQLTRELIRLSAKSTDVQVKADTAAAASHLSALNQQASRLDGRTINLKVDDKGLSQSIVGVAALSRALGTIALPAGLIAATPYVLSFASALVQAAGAAALLPAGLVAGGVAAGTLAVGLSGIGDTFKKLAKEDETAAATATAGGKAREAALKGVRSAATALEDAQRAADRAGEDGAQRVADARQSLADAIVRADERIASARRSLADAMADAERDVQAAQDNLTRSQERAQLAQEALTRAHKDAREELQQLQFSVEGAALAEEEASDRLDDARKRLTEARAGGADTETIDDLDRAVRQADLSLREAADRYTDLKAEGAEWARTGISGSQGVVAANRQLIDANRAVGASEDALGRARLEGDRAVADADAALAKARIEGDRSVSDARRDLGRTIVAVGQQQADATRAVERAAVALAEAQTAAVAGSAATAAAMAKLSPQARALVGEIRALGPAWTAMRLDVQDRLLAGIGVRIGQLGRTYIPILGAALGTVADGYNRAGQSALDFLGTASATTSIRLGLDNVAQGTSLASQAMVPLTRAFTDLFAVGSTFLPSLGAGVSDLATRFADFIGHARETGQLSGWIRAGLDSIKLFGQVMLNVGRIIKSALDAAKGSGESFLVTIERFTGKIAAGLRTPEGAAGLEKFFTGIRTVVGLAIDKLVQLWPVISAAGGAFVALLQGAAPVTGLFLTLVSTILPPLLDAIGWLAPVLGPPIALFGVGAAAMWAWNLAVSAGQVAMTGYRIAVAIATALINPIATATKIWAGVQWLLNAALSANPIGIVIVVLAALVAAIVLAWQHSETFRDIVTAALNGIAAVASWLWGDVLKPAFDAVVWVLKNVVGPVVVWLWTAIFKPYFEAIGALVKSVWEWIIKPAWDALVWTIRNVIGPAAMWLWNSVIKPAWDGIGNIISGVWRNVIKPAWDAIVGGLNWVGDNFSRVVDWIGNVWGRIRGFLARPINFMIGVVWNEGIRKAWNLVAGILPGINPIAPLPLIKEMAQGGPIAGGIPGKDSVPILAMQDEFVVRREIARPARNFLEALNAGQPEAIQAAGGRFAKFAAGGPVEKGINFARAQHGKPYIWGGVGPQGFDCSGFISAIANTLMGRPPYRRIGTTDSAPWPGWTRGLDSAFGVGFFKGNPGHMAGTLAGNNVEAGGSPSRTKFVQNAAGARSGQFTGHMSLPQVGGEFVGGEDGGGFFNWVADKIRQWVKEIIDPAIGRLPQPPPAFAGIPRSLATLVRDKALDWFLGKSDSGTAAPGSGPVRQQVQGVAGRFGWGGGPQWGALDWLINKESSWNPLAKNPRSTAFGLYQFLDSTWATVGGTKTSNPGLQAEYGNRYIGKKYRDPIGAKSFHQSHGWYDNGGWLPPGYSTVYNGTGRAEAVFNQQQLQMLRDGTGDRGGITNNWTVYEVNDAAETAMKIQRRQELSVRTQAPL